MVVYWNVWVVCNGHMDLHRVAWAYMFRNGIGSMICVGVTDV